ncbi:MAG TPA: hypothetical protein VFO89_01100 [Thermoanaerobaculia bacterium]|nr:hypothetical protein [Thermoanaerobaculia bacterium]
MAELQWGQRRQLLQFFVESIRSHPTWPVVISEGDSWFSFPIHANLIDHLDDFTGRKMSLLRLERSSDEMVDMTTDAKLSTLRGYLHRYKPHALLWSGGGNDVVGPELLKFIAPRGQTFDLQAALGTTALKKRIDEIRNAYQRVIAARDASAPDCLIFTHGYGRVIPSGRKAKLWGISVGPWIKPFLEAQGYRNRKEQQAIVDELLRRFNAILDAFAGPKFIKCDVAAVIGPDEWNDEIHPTRKGFEDAALIFLAALKTHLPAKFL